MTEVPSVPDEFDSEEEVEQYINRLRNQIEFLEEELEKTENGNLELKQELNEIEDHISGNEEEIKYIRASLQEFVDRMESIDLHGSPSDVGLQDGLRDAF